MASAEQVYVTSIVDEGPLVAPGQAANVADYVPKKFSKHVTQSCVNLYKKAFAKRHDDFVELDGRLNAKRNQFGGNFANALTGQITSKFAGRQATIQKVIKYDEKDFLEFFNQDLGIFHGRDVDHSGFLENKEFIPLLETEANFGMTTEEAEQVMKEWDVDKSNTIGPFEWAAFNACKRAEVTYNVEKEKTAVLIKAMDECIPGSKGCCPECCLPCLLPCASCCILWGVCFACCTCGLSLCIPVCCAMCIGAAADSRAPELHMNLEAAERRGKIEGNTTAKRIIMEGPEDDLKKGVKKWQRESMEAYTKSQDGGAKVLAV